MCVQACADAKPRESATETIQARTNFCPKMRVYGYMIALFMVCPQTWKKLVRVKGEKCRDVAIPHRVRAANGNPNGNIGDSFIMAERYSTLLQCKSIVGKPFLVKVKKTFEAHSNMSPR